VLMFFLRRHHDVWPRDRAAHQIIALDRRL
jgi:hypothetical protein